MIFPRAGTYRDCNGICSHVGSPCDGECAAGYAPCGNINRTQQCIKDQGEDTFR